MFRIGPGVGAGVRVDQEPGVGVRVGVDQEPGVGVRVRVGTTPPRLRIPALRYAKTLLRQIQSPLDQQRTLQE